MSAKEIKSLTGIRGLAALYVIIFHWYVEISNKQLPYINGFVKTIIGHGYLSVDLFFVLSGFVLCLSSYKLFDHFRLKDYLSFLYKRFSRIFPLYICITLLYYMIFKYKLINLFVNLTLFQGIIRPYNNSIIPPGWSLTNEWILYFIFPLLFFLILKTKIKPWMLIAITVAILVTLSFIRSYGVNWANHFHLKGIKGFHPVISFTRGPASLLRTLSAYLLGIAAFLWYQKKTDTSYFKYVIALLFVMLYISKSDVFLILLMPFALLFLTETSFISKFLASKFIYFIGLISYSLYLNHYLFIKTYAKTAKLLGINNSLFSFFYVIGCSLIFSILTYYVIEKPGMNFFKRLRFKNSSVTVLN